MFSAAPKYCSLFVAGALVLLPAPALAQEPPVDTVDEVVVVARRAGAPMWTVERGGSTVILVGAIAGVPRDYAWRPEALEAATRRSQRILYPTEGRASFSDILRLLWRIRTIARLPRGQTTADVLPPELQARLERVMADERSDRWRTQSLVGLGFDLTEKAGLERGGRGAVDAVRRAAREARVDGRPVGFVRGDEMVESLISAPPAAYVPCIAASVAAAEIGPDGAAARLDAWRSLRVPDVVAAPLDQALNLCWPSGDPEIAPELRRHWTEAVQAAVAEPGVTLAVAPLRLLAEPGGVLDQLEAAGLDPAGPPWRSDQ
ncbi:TraB/GumN family protein [Brevundimonas sp. VNH65]|uniref:TraB/GumN family protein n=1 Tax=Brevundimonas sp. VNH65 TaxID=3400917 RepID=UPI003C0CDF23